MYDTVTKFNLAAASALLLLFCVSCASTANFDYRNAPGRMLTFPDAPKQTTVTVVPFKDERLTGGLGELTQDNTLLKDRGSFALGWLPLIPLAWVSKPCPENSSSRSCATLRSFWCQFDRELAEAAAASLEYSQLFREVVRSYGKEPPATDYIFRGTVTNTEYQGERITYGLTYLGAPMLWLIGFPTAVSHNTLSVKFELVETATGEVKWSLDYDGKDYIVHWLLARVGKDTSRYPILMKTAMNAALHDLHNTLLK